MEAPPANIPLPKDFQGLQRLCHVWAGSVGPREEGQFKWKVLSQLLEDPHSGSKSIFSSAPKQVSTYGRLIAKVATFPQPSLRAGALPCDPPRGEVS